MPHTHTLSVALAEYTREVEPTAIDYDLPSVLRAVAAVVGDPAEGLRDQVTVDGHGIHVAARELHVVFHDHAGVWHVVYTHADETHRPLQVTFVPFEAIVGIDASGVVQRDGSAALQVEGRTVDGGTVPLTVTPVEHLDGSVTLSAVRRAMTERSRDGRPRTPGF